MIDILDSRQFSEAAGESFPFFWRFVVFQQLFSRTCCCSNRRGGFLSQPEHFCDNSVARLGILISRMLRPGASPHSFGDQGRSAQHGR
jgi:hypothetical protein